MAVNGARHIVNLFTGDFVAEYYYDAAENASSPAQTDLINLASGANTLTPPANATGLTILPPSGNLNVITLKGVSGDTGIALHKTDPTSIGLNTTTTLVLGATTTIIGVRTIWS